MTVTTELLKKYDIPVPRYTSYPTVPYWSESPSREQWLSEVKRAIEKPETSWSMYIHIPYCETLCTFCGCNTTISKNHSKEKPYVDLLLAERDLYLQDVSDLKTKPLRQLHLGGGTPTFLSAKHLSVLVKEVLNQCTVDFQQFEGSFEVDPRRTNKEQLKVLRDLGFQRISLGVQDFNHKVQYLVNRIQPFEQTQQLTEQARNMGYESVNFDLIYGLPKQDLEAMKKTMDLTLQLRPDRIALYSLAVVPWIKPAQKLFKDEDLPKGAEKRALYELARKDLLAEGYKEVGMDHFALETDSLFKSWKSKTMHRNFMGYTDLKTEILLGLGVSAISETPSCFHQNEKVLPVYEQKVNSGLVPTSRGHLLSQEDRQQREKILKFMTQFEVLLTKEEQIDAQEFLSELQRDGLVQLSEGKLKLTEEGHPFLRNACMVLDKRLRQKQPQTKVFSQAL